MTRRRKKAPFAAYWLECTPDLARAFLAPADWTPPANIRVHPGKRHTTLTARFMTPEGHPNTARVRVERDCVTGGLVVVATELTMSFRKVGSAG